MSCKRTALIYFPKRAKNHNNYFGLLKKQKRRRRKRVKWNFNNKKIYYTFMTFIQQHAYDSKKFECFLKHLLTNIKSLYGSYIWLPPSALPWILLSCLSWVMAAILERTSHTPGPVRCTQPSLWLSIFFLNLSRTLSVKKWWESCKWFNYLVSFPTLSLSKAL